MISVAVFIQGKPIVEDFHYIQWIYGVMDTTSETMDRLASVSQSVDLDSGLIRVPLHGADRHLSRF